MILLYLLFLCVVTWEGACREESLEKPVSVQNLRGISGDKAKSERSMDESISRKLKKFNAYKAYDNLPAGQRPPQYGKDFPRARSFPINEYLGSSQLRAKKIRYSQDKAEYMWDASKPQLTRNSS